MNWPQRAYYVSLLAYLALLPIAETIALRNLLLLALLCLLAFFIVFQPSRLIQSPKNLLSQPYWPLWFWIIFLCLFPFWAVQSETAWANLRGQWGTSIAAWAVGLGAVWVHGRRGPGLWTLANASAFLVGLHLLLSFMAYMGLFGRPVPLVMTVDMMWQESIRTLSSQSSTSWGMQNFSWGFRGFDPMHGNLGYTATQAVALFSVCFLFGWRHHQPKSMAWAALGIVLCFLSVVIAYSRGSVLYALLVVLLALAVFVFKLRGDSALRTAAEGGRSLSRYRRVLLLLTLLFALAFVLIQSFQKDSRWYTLFDKARVAFLVDDPVEFLCEGPSQKVQNQLRERLALLNSSYVEELIRGLNGDGVRILLMRASVGLLLQHPLGLDGSRHSYKKLMEERCGHAPVMEFAHSHQAWIDTALALGWGGSLLLAFLFLYFIRSGWQLLRNEKCGPWAFALLLIAAFWLLRGFADSIYREHYLQMQALLLGYLFGRMQLEVDVTDSSVQA